MPEQEPPAPEQLPPEAKILALRAFKLLKNEQIPGLVLLELHTDEGVMRYGATREILETLAQNMNRAASTMPEPGTRTAAPAVAPTAKPAKPVKASRK